jgi:hypothetical protein
MIYADGTAPLFSGLVADMRNNMEFHKDVQISVSLLIGAQHTCSAVYVTSGIERPGSWEHERSGVGSKEPWKASTSRKKLFLGCV